MEQLPRRFAWLAALAPANIALLLTRMRLRRQPAATVQFALDDLPNPVVIKDRDGNYLAVNRALERLLGLPASAIVGRHTSEMSSQTDAERHLQMDRTLLRDGGLQQYETAFEHPDGSRHTFLFTKSVFPATGPAQGTISSLVDVTAQKRIEQRLADSEAAYRNIVEAANEGIWIIDRHGLTTFVNPRMADALGYTVAEFTGRSMYDFMDDDARHEAERNMQRRSQQIDEVHDFRFRHRDGSSRWFIIGTKTLIGADGDFDGALGMLTDITARKATEDALAQAQRDLERRVAERTAALLETTRSLQQRQKAIDASSHAVMIVAVEAGRSRLEYANGACERITGLPAAEMLGRPWEQVLRIDAALPEARTLAAAFAAGRDADAVVALHGTGPAATWCHVYVSVVPDGAPGSRTFVLAAYDITKVRLAEERLERLTHFDALTGLPNATLLAGRIDEALLASTGPSDCFQLAMIELDRFHVTSKAVGQVGSDRLLQEVAQRLAAAVGPDDTVARTGNEQFCVLLRGLDGVPAPLLAGLQALVAEPVHVGGQIVQLSATMGVASQAAGTPALPGIFERARIAAGRARLLGRGGVAHYDDAMGVADHARLEIEIALSKAVTARQFRLQYQPKIDIASRRTVGFEALLRWTSPELGPISPATFIPLLEESGDIIDIGYGVLVEACRQVRHWNGVAAAPLHMSVNLSARQFADADLTRHVQQALAESGLEAHHLVLEITESALVGDIEHAIATMNGLRKLGVGLSIDDFGTGYSSLAYLKRFPLTELKIDQSFVRDVLSRAEDALIVTLVINLARDMGLHVVAEGVETAGQLAFLSTRGCQTIQGYLFSKPVDAVTVPVGPAAAAATEFAWFI